MLAEQIKHGKDEVAKLGVRDKGNEDFYVNRDSPFFKPNRRWKSSHVVPLSLVQKIKKPYLLWIRDGFIHGLDPA